MRLLIALIAAVLLCVPAIAGDAPLIRIQDNMGKTQYAVEYKLFSGERIVQETAVVFLEGYPAQILTYTKRGAEGIPGVEVVENLRGLILAGTADCEFTKPDDFTDKLWDGFWLAAEHLTIGEIDFYVYSPGADRIVISVDKLYTIPPASGNTRVDKQQVRTFLGEIEQPYSCREIGRQQYMLELSGHKDGALTRSNQVAMIPTTGMAAVMMCRPPNETLDAEQGYPSCLMLVVSTDALETDLGRYTADALNGHLAPPLNTVILGDFAILYYFPDSDTVEFTLHELADPPNDNWQSEAKLIGRKRVPNDQPEPSAL